MTAIINDVGKSTLSDGTTITNANTGVSGNTNVGITGTAPVKRIDYSLPQPLSDTAWYEHPSTISGTATCLTFFPGTLVAATGGAMGAWFILSQNPSANIQLIRFGNSGVNYVGLNVTGKLFLVATTTLYVTTLSVPFNTLLWISHAADSKASNGTSRLGWWDKKGVLVETFSSTTAVTNSIATATSSVGKVSGNGVAGIIRTSSLRANNDASTLISPAIPKGIRGWGVAA